MSTMIQRCSTPTCPASIRFTVGQSGLWACRWCQAGTSYYAHPAQPDCMPHPENLWPNLTELERERRVRMPHNQERFRQYPELYKRWIT